MKDVFKVFFLGFIGIKDKTWFLTFFTQVYIKCLNRFSREDKIRVGIEINHKKRTKFDFKGIIKSSIVKLLFNLDLVKLIVKTIV